MSALVRINRYIASAGLGSRRRCEELIKKGSVFLNGRLVEKLSTTVDPEKDTVTVNGKRVTPGSRTIVLAVNKPTGVLSTVSDAFYRKTVVELVREKGYTDRLYPVGRLDRDTSGILLLTNDGDLAYRLTHPRFKIDKTYRVVVEGEVSDAVVSRIAGGIREDSLTTQPCTVKVLKRHRETTELEVTLKEGKKRQIRRMFKLVGHRVVTLHRSAVGDLTFDDLNTGEMRQLSRHEEMRLRELTGLL